MTATQVTEFLEKVSGDEALQQELAGALAAEDDRQAVTNLAQAKGYEFTPEELWAEVQKRHAEVQKQQDSDELSDEDLEAVAGGATPGVIAAGTAIAGLAYGVAPAVIKKIKW